MTEVPEILARCELNSYDSEVCQVAAVVNTELHLLLSIKDVKYSEKVKGKIALYLTY